MKKGCGMKQIIVTILLVLLPFTALCVGQPKWTNICPDPGVPYCKDVGKDAYNNTTNPPLLRGIKVGKIVGVSWRPKGSVIGISEAIQKAGIPEEIRTSPRDAYYYIIDDGSGKPFLRQCREIDAK